MKLTEAQLNRLIRESIDEVCKEEGMDEANFFNKIKNRASSLINGGNYDKMMAADTKEEIAQQIRKSQEIVNREQAKINRLRQEYNEYVDNIGDPSMSRMSTDGADFYNQEEMDRRNDAWGNAMARQKADSMHRLRQAWGSKGGKTAYNNRLNTQNQYLNTQNQDLINANRGLQSTVGTMANRIKNGKYANTQNNRGIVAESLNRIIKNSIRKVLG